MTFVDYLKSKRNFLIIWFLIHGFALFVNVFHIQGNNRTVKDYIEERTAHEDVNDINIFTSPESHLVSAQKNTEAFWPFVEFYKHQHLGPDYSTTGYEGNKADKYVKDFIDFNGIFFQYDYSEFIAYSILIILIFYFIWNSRFSNSKNKSL